MDVKDILIIALVIFLALFVVFLLIREYISWYFKINKRIRLEQKINKNLELLIKGLAQSNILSATVLQEMQSDNTDKTNKRTTEFSPVPASGNEKASASAEQKTPVEETEPIPEDIPDL